MTTFARKLSAEEVVLLKELAASDDVVVRRRAGSITLDCIDDVVSEQPFQDGIVRLEYEILELRTELRAHEPLARARPQNLQVGTTVPDGLQFDSARSIQARRGVP